MSVTEREGFEELPRRPQKPSTNGKKRATKASETMVKATIKPLRMEILRCEIEGIEPLVLHRFSEKAMAAMTSKMKMPIEAQTQARNKRSPKPPRDFEGDREAASYIATEHDGGWSGLPCAHLRNAIIAATATTDIAKAPMKRAVFVVPQGHDAKDLRPLIRIIGECRTDISHARNSGIGARADIRARPRWDEWSAVFDVEFDSDAVDAPSLRNLLDRAGKLIGIGEGRPDSKMSNGIDWGRFKVNTVEHIAVRK